jgi:hypothetical protein
MGNERAGTQRSLFSLDPVALAGTVGTCLLVLAVGWVVGGSATTFAMATAGPLAILVGESLKASDA